MLHTVQHTPVISEYSVSGTTFAPEGIIFDSSGSQVVYFGYSAMETLYMRIHFALFYPCFFNIWAHYQAWLSEISVATCKTNDTLQTFFY